jgi:hypothetical protein
MNSTDIDKELQRFAKLDVLQRFGLTPGGNSKAKLQAEIDALRPKVGALK